MLPNWLYGKSKSKLASILGVPADYDQVKAQVNQNAEDIDELSSKSTLTTLSAIKNDSIVGSSFNVKVRKQYNAVYITGYFNTTVAANRYDLLFTISGLTFLDANDHFYATIMSSAGYTSYAEIYSDGTVKKAGEDVMPSNFYAIQAVLIVE